MANKTGSWIIEMKFRQTDEMTYKSIHHPLSEWGYK